MHIREVGSTVEVRPLDPEVGQPLEESEPQKANTVRNETDVITEQPRYQGKQLTKTLLSAHMPE